MKRQKYRRPAALIISILLACVFCAVAAAEETGAYVSSPEEIIRHRLWGFFSAWAEEDTGWMMHLCSDQWKKEKEDPEQALQIIMDTGLPYGYKVNSITGEYGDESRTVYVTLQRETEDGGYAYTRHGILIRRDEEGNYGINPDGIVSGEPGEPVPEEEMVLLTPEGLIRASMDFHAEEGLYDRLIPINARVEKQGICVEVISGLVQEKVAWFMISLQDTAEKYSEYGLEPTFVVNINDSYSHWWMKIYHDEAENKDIYLVGQELEREVQLEDSKVTAGISDIHIREGKTVDLFPLLKQYGKTESGVKAPETEEHYYQDTTVIPDDLKVLNAEQPLDHGLFRDIYLTGIGWIDNQLHIQFHNRGREYIEMRNGRAGACSVWIDQSVCGKAETESSVDYSPLVWDGDNDGWSDWTEFIIDCSQEEAYRLELSAEISVTKEILEDDWSVQIPLNRICTVAGPEMAEEKKTDTAVPEETGTEIDAIHFPDAALREQVKQYDADEDGKLSKKEAESATEIDIRGKSVKTIKGIEHLTGLEYLECSDNLLAELDVSRNAGLKYLSCGHNQLTALDVSRNTELRDLNCIYNHISALDLSKNRKLTDLSVSANFLTELDVSHNPGLKWLVCPWNHLTSLDLGYNPELTNLSCGGNWLTELDLSNNSLLETVYCTDNNLTALDISSCPELVRLVSEQKPSEITAELEWIAGTGDNVSYLYTDNTVKLYTTGPEGLSPNDE